MVRKGILILFVMISENLFYPEAMLRPELKDFRIAYYSQAFFEDFYSEALYHAIYHKNSEAIRFLLNLDDSFYTVPLEEGYESDFSMKSDATPNSVNHPKPVSVKTLNNLRLIFSNENVLQLNPDIHNFTFCNFNLRYFMESFKGTFPNLMLLYNNFIQSIEEFNRTAGQKRKFDK